MQLERLDHVNLRTANLEAMVDWYRDVLGMRAGTRPPFPFPGAWLYVGDAPAVHLIGVAEAPAALDPKIEHFAFFASGLAKFLLDLARQGVPFNTARVPGGGAFQVNVYDPDGNHIHVDFAADEADALGL